MRAVLFTVLFYGWTAVMGIPALALLPGPPRLLAAYSRVWIRSGLWILRATTGIAHTVRGTANIPDGPALFAVKHQSAWDTLAINLVVRDAAIVVKRELTWIPVFGWCLVRAGHIAIDRAGGMSALRRMVAAARARLAQGRSVVIYPEGTRVAPGAKRPYHAGVAALNAALDVPVVPVALNSGLFWPRRSLDLRRGVITIEFLPPVPRHPARRDFVDALHDAIEKASGRLLREALDAHPELPPPRPVDNTVDDRPPG